jgi:hypothetical protein
MDSHIYSGSGKGRRYSTLLSLFLPSEGAHILLYFTRDEDYYRPLKSVEFRSFCRPQQAFIHAILFK